MKRVSLLSLLLFAVFTGGAWAQYPATIASVDDWNAFCAAVNGGHDYSGETVTMTVNVGPITTMAGTDENRFAGTFDGQGHSLRVDISDTGENVAPFRFVKSVTIKNLTVTGSIEGGYHTGGLIGRAVDSEDNTINIENCFISAVVMVKTLGGGMVGCNLSSTTNITNCIFNGTINNTQYENHSDRAVGGLVGWCEAKRPNHYYGAHLNISNTVFAGQYLGNGSAVPFHPIAARIQNEGTVEATASNTYYLIDPSPATDGNYVYTGTRACRIWGGDDVNVTVHDPDADTVQTVNGIKFYTSRYNSGMRFQGFFYGVKGGSYQLDLEYTGSGSPVYTSTTGTLCADCNPYILMMDGADAIINASLADFDIITSTGNAQSWDDFAAAVIGGNTYSGQTVELLRDVDVTTMVGASGNPFGGTFDGHNHTINVSITSTEQGVAPFHYISTATIKNLKVTGTVNGTNDYHAGGLVGFSTTDANFAIENCLVSTTVNMKVLGGGIVGHARNSDATFTGCAFDGVINNTQASTNNNHSVGGLVGWTDGGNQFSFTDCIFAGSYTGTGSTVPFHPIAYRSTEAATTSNCYYTIDPSEGTSVDLGQRAYSIKASGVNIVPSGTPTTYSASGIWRYGTSNGLLFDGLLYSTNGSSLNLALTGGGNSYQTDYGTLTNNGSDYTLTMVDHDTRISGDAGSDVYSDFNVHDFQSYEVLVGKVMLDGKVITAENYADFEVSAFVDGELRGSHLLRYREGDAYATTGLFGVYFNKDRANQLVSFKLYNHRTGKEYNGCVINEPVYVNQRYADEYWETPITLSFSNGAYAKRILAYTPGSKDRYYLIATPLAGDDNGETNPADVDNMLENEYDLYYFDQTGDEAGNEWINYKAANDGFNLKSGQGYLYANSNNVTLIFDGEPYEGDGSVTLTKDNNASFAGWNLIGNRYPQVAYISKPYYRMNDGGTEIIASEGAIQPMEGVFVIADSNEESITFSTMPSRGSNSKLSIDLCQEQGIVDRAIVRFGEGSTLPKFQIREGSTKIYISQDAADYAIVNSDGKGELPVYFKAEKNGNYTMNFNDENVSFSYLHLIDNLTGNDVDLLTTSSYSFEAKTTDYASRFRLVFDGKEDEAPTEDDEPFAFYSDGKIIIDNDGEAILQVIDVEGRILSIQTIRGDYSKSFEGTPGVYMIRLIRNNQMKVQKVVVY